MAAASFLVPVLQLLVLLLVQPVSLLHKVVLQEPPPPHLFIQEGVCIGKGGGLFWENTSCKTVIIL